MTICCRKKGGAFGFGCWLAGPAANRLGFPIKYIGSSRPVNQFFRARRSQPRIGPPCSATQRSFSARTRSPGASPSPETATARHRIEAADGREGQNRQPTASQPTTAKPGAAWSADRRPAGRSRSARQPASPPEKCARRGRTPQAAYWGACSPDPSHRWPKGIGALIEGYAPNDRGRPSGARKIQGHRG